MGRRTIVIMLSCLLLFAACQPTPEQDAVVNKANGKLEVIVASSPVPLQDEQHAETPVATESAVENEELFGAGGRLQDIKGQQWQEDFFYNEMSIHIDTYFEAVGNTCPVYEVSAVLFDSAFANEFLERVAGETTQMRDDTMTLEEVKAALEGAMRGQMIEIDGRITYEPYEGQEEEIAYWGNLYNQMQKSGEEFAWEEVSEIQKLPHQKFYQTAEGSSCYIYIAERYLSFTMGEKSLLVAQPESMVLEGDAILGEPEGTSIEVNGLSAEEAITIGAKAMEKAGIHNLKLASCEKARMVDVDFGRVAYTGYMLFYSVGWDNYLPADYMNIHTDAANDKEQEEYATPWQFEYAYVFVDEKGEAQEIYWQYPIQEEALLNENVSILTLEETKTRILNQLRFLYATHGEGQVEVNRIFLSGLPIKRPGSANGMLVPTWIVEYTYNDDLAYHDQPFLLAVNAIDGSIIDLTKGY